MRGSLITDVAHGFEDLAMLRINFDIQSLADFMECITQILHDG
jgi:hypothetical protein